MQAGNNASLQEVTVSSVLRNRYVTKSMRRSYLKNIFDHLNKIDFFVA